METIEKAAEMINGWLNTKKELPEKEWDKDSSKDVLIKMKYDDSISFSIASFDYNYNQWIQYISGQKFCLSDENVIEWKLIN